MTTTAVEAAVAAYCDLGWSIFPIPDGLKKTTELGWPDAPEDPWRAVREQPANVAVRLGERSSYLADVDLDDDAARAVAPLLLPATGCQLGRDNVAGITHRFYVCPDGPPRGQPGTTKKGPVELRWTGAYTVVPPSRHPEGGRYRWQPGEFMPVLAPPAVAWGTLHRSVTEVAAAALLLRCYPEWARAGERHLATLALAGALLGEGWDLPRVERFVFALATAGADEEAADRVDNARSQWDALQRGAPMTGWRSLVGYAGSARVDLVRRYLGFLDAGGGATWAAIMGQSSRTNGVGGTPPQQPPQATQTPNVAPKAPVISTAAAAQAATSQAKNQQKQIKSSDVAWETYLTISASQRVAKDEGEALYLYRGGVYREDVLNGRLRLLIQDEVLDAHGQGFLTPELVKDVLYHLQTNAPLLEERPREGWLNCRNGLVDLVTGVLHPHTPDVLTTVQLPVDWDMNAVCPAFERFCRQVFPGDAVDKGVPLEVVALCVIPFLGVEKAILLLGIGENGKSIFLDVMRRLVGDENCSDVSLQRIGNNPFSTADLRGKLLNISTDLPGKRLEDSGDFKAIVSGETIRAERKHQPAFRFVPYCRLLYSANNLPGSADTSYGYVRRWHILPFDRQFDVDDPERVPRKVLMERLSTPAELSGILAAALPAMRRFLIGAQPTVTDSMQEAIEEFRDILDPFPVWLRSQLQEVGQGWVETAALVARYQEKLGRRGIEAAISPKAVAIAMKDSFPNAVPEQRRVGGTGKGGALTTATGSKTGARLRGWRGVSWRLGL
jgi:P4 family phage/plasmid primase-like protien